MQPATAPDAACVSSFGSAGEDAAAAPAFGSGEAAVLVQPGGVVAIRTRRFDSLMAISDGRLRRGWSDDCAESSLRIDRRGRKADCFPSCAVCLLSVPERAASRVPAGGQSLCIGSKMLAADKLLLQSNVKQRSIELREKEVCASQKEACCNVEPCHNVCW